MVAQLMDIEKQQLDRLDKNQALLSSQRNQYTRLSTLLKDFNTRISELTPILNQNAYKTTSSDNTILSAVANSGQLPPGTHTINVTKLAQAHQISSQAYAKSTDALNLSGTLELSVGAATLAISLTPADTLETLRQQINNAPTNPGVVASILSTSAADGSPEYRLVLNAKQTGTDYAVMLGGDALSSLDLTHCLTEAQNAQFSFDGFNVARSSNTVTDVLEGVEMTLLQASKSATLTISADVENKVAQVKSGLQNIIEVYNGVIESLDKNQSSSQFRDSTYGLIKLRLKAAMEQSFGSGNLNTVLDMGFKLEPSEKLLNDVGNEYVVNGKLSLDEDRVAQNVRDNFLSVNQFFTKPSSGFIATFSNLMTSLSQDGGSIDTREKNIEKQGKALDSRILREEDRLDRVRENMIQQYSILDAFMQRYQQMSNYLTQQFDAMNNMHSK